MSSEMPYLGTPPRERPLSGPWLHPFYFSLCLNGVLATALYCGWSQLEQRNAELQRTVFDLRIKHEGWHRLRGLPDPVPPEPKAL